MSKSHIQASTQQANAIPTFPTILRIPTTKARSGYSRSTIYLRIAQGLWTKQVILGPRCVGWPENEVSALNAARIAGRSDDEIRALVLRLEAARKTAA